jgi:hypothetical protein
LSRQSIGLIFRYLTELGDASAGQYYIDRQYRYILEQLSSVYTQHIERLDSNFFLIHG